MYFPVALRSYQTSLNFHSEFDAAFVGRHGAWFFAKLVLDAFLFPYFQDAHEGIDAVRLRGNPHQRTSA